MLDYNVPAQFMPGKPVWYINWRAKKRVKRIKEEKVFSIELYENDNFYIWLGGNDYVHKDDIPTMLFATREEAEAMLNERFPRKDICPKEEQQ